MFHVLDPSQSSAGAPTMFVTVTILCALLVGGVGRTRRQTALFGAGQTINTTWYRKKKFIVPRNAYMYMPLRKEM